jgi:glycosyltransferase involved in cell wall biosynthesis
MVWPTDLPKSQTHPPVSILTPTYNRGRFIPALIECIKAQTYPRERVEWLIYDDGTEPIMELLLPVMAALNIRYFRSETKVSIGAKRNKLHDEARGSVLVTMDDDDYYAPERVAHAVQTLLSRKVQIVGSSKNHLYFTDDGSIWQSGPFSPNHATFGTMAYTKAYTKTHRCDETVTHAEEIIFTSNYKEPMAQLDPMKVMLVMAHSDNTFDKGKLRDSPNAVFKKTGFVLKNFIRSAKQRDFYASA